MLYVDTVNIFVFFVDFYDTPIARPNLAKPDGVYCCCTYISSSMYPAPVRPKAFSAGAPKLTYGLPLVDVLCGTHGTCQVNTGRESSSAVLSIVCEELGIGDPSHFFED